MGLTPGVKHVAIGDQSTLRDASLPLSSRDIPASLAATGITTSPTDCIQLERPRFDLERGANSSALLAICGSASLTIVGNGAVTTIDGDGLIIGQSGPSHPEGWPGVRLNPIGDRDTVMRVSVDDTWGVVVPPSTPENKIGSFNNRISITSDCATETRSFLLLNPTIDRAATRTSPSAPDHTTSRSADLDLQLVEAGVNLRDSEPSNRTDLCAQKTVADLLGGRCVLVLSDITEANMGARPGYNPSLWDGTNVALSFPNGAHRVLVVGTPLLTTDTTIKDGISVVIEGCDGTRFTQTRTFSGEIRIHSANGEFRIEDLVKNGDQTQAHTIFNAKMVQEPSIVLRGSPAGAAVVRQVAAMLPFETVAEIRANGLLRLHPATAELAPFVNAGGQWFSTLDKTSHRVGLAGMGDRTAFAGQTANGTTVTLMPNTLTTGNYQVICEFKNPIQISELQALIKQSGGNISGLNQDVYISGSPLPSTANQALLGFTNSRAMLRFLKGLD